MSAHYEEDFGPRGWEFIYCYWPEKGWNNFESWHATDRIIGCFSSPEGTHQMVMPLIREPLHRAQKHLTGVTQYSDLGHWGVTAKYGWTWDPHLYNFYNPNSPYTYDH